jgi:hypothetical protein
MRSTDGRILSTGRLALALAAVVLLFVAILVAQASLLFGEDQTDGMTGGTQRAFDVPELATAATWPNSSEIAADGRSLFVPKVAATPQAAAPVEPQPEETQEQLGLVAVLIAPSGKFALLRAQQSQEIQQIKEGGAVGGWNLAAVEANRVILKHGDRQTILYLPDTIPENP